MVVVASVFAAEFSANPLMACIQQMTFVSWNTQKIWWRWCASLLYFCIVDAPHHSINKCVWRALSLHLSHSITTMSNTRKEDITNFYIILFLFFYSYMILFQCSLFIICTMPQSIWFSLLHNLSMIFFSSFLHQIQNNFTDFFFCFTTNLFSLYIPFFLSFWLSIWNSCL